MSVGEQRRVLLGPALVHDPIAIILDKPTIGLDAQECFRYLACMRTNMQQGHMVILLTHHLYEIPPEIDRVGLLKDGKVVGDGQNAHLLTTDRLSHLFETPLPVLEREGWYQLLPKG